jgi:ABC-type Zn2+ transport system substrate-binding protein/surface adhesin
MRRMRPFVVLLMSLAVCLQGHAGVRLMDASCPMWHAHDAQAMHEHEHHHDHGQAPEASSSHDTGSPHCNGHLGCDPASAGLVAAQVFPVFRPLIEQSAAGIAPAFRSCTISLLWRPPAHS